MVTREIRLLTHAAGPDFNVKPGDTITLEERICSAMVSGGYAEYVDAETTVVSEPAPEPAVALEAAVLEPSEAAVQPRARGRRRV